MKLEHRIVVRAPRGPVWDSLMDLPEVALCVPGVEALTPHGDDRYEGHLRVGVGPIRLNLGGELELVSRDDESGRAVLRGNGTDARLGGGVRVLLTLSVAELDGDRTQLTIESDVQVLGRIGELGQPIMKRKADDLMRAFADCLSKRLQ